MCYNTKVSRKKKELEEHYRVTALVGNLEENEELIYNVANGFSHPHLWIIPQEKPNNLIPVMWGLIPSYKKGVDPKVYYKETIRWGSGLNAQSEKLFESNNYKQSALKRRCIIPVDGFFESHRIEGVKKPYSIPFYFERNNGTPFNLAGIYAVAGNLVTFTVLSKPATPMFSEIHNKKNRRPVIIQDADIDVWLDSTLNESEVYKVINDDLSDADINAWPISRDVYKKDGSSNRKDITERVDYEDLEIEY